MYDNHNPNKKIEMVLACVHKKIRGATQNSPSLNSWWRCGRTKADIKKVNKEKSMTIARLPANRQKWIYTGCPMYHLGTKRRWKDYTDKRYHCISGCSYYCENIAWTSPGLEWKMLTNFSIIIIFKYNILNSHLATSSAGTHAPGLYPIMPLYSLAKMKSCRPTWPLSILVHWFCT